MNGYAMRGTDEVEEQGFTYWEESDQQAGSRRMGSYRAPTVPETAIKVTATGQVMSAKLTGLNGGRTYHYVAFMTTSKGVTYYGEELTFTVDGTTDIETYCVENNESVELMRYDLQGRRLDAPQRGINVIKMSNGTTKKIFVK